MDLRKERVLEIDSGLLDQAKETDGRPKKEFRSGSGDTGEAGQFRVILF